MSHDPGDEHVEVVQPIVELDLLSQLLIDYPGAEVSEYTMRMIMLAEAYRYCCHACALEVDGEDGS